MDNVYKNLICQRYITNKYKERLCNTLMFKEMNLIKNCDNAHGPRPTPIVEIRELRGAAVTSWTCVYGNWICEK